MTRLRRWIDELNLGDMVPSTPGLAPVFRKEMADHLRSYRFLIIFALVALAGLSSAYVATQTLGETLRDVMNQSFTFAVEPYAFLRIFTTSSGQLPSFLQFVSLLGPLLGIGLGFDAINGERNTGNLSRVISQPLYRDSIINGKFLAGLAVIAMMLLALVFLVAGLGLLIIGIPPMLEEVLRILLFTGLTVVYVAFWLGVSILFSVLFRQTTTSALASIGVWLFLTLFAVLLAGMIANTLVPLGPEAGVDRQLTHLQVRQWTQRLAPNYLYQEATSALLSPEISTLGPYSPSVQAQQQDAIPAQLPLGQSLLLIWPHLVGLIGGTMALFGISYVTFIRQEIRAT